MIKISKIEIRPYFCKVILTDTNGDNEIYTDEPSMYQAMVSKFTHVLNCKVENTVLTDKQNERLAALQSLVGELETKSEPEASNFVKYGYISPFDNCNGGVCSPQPMLKLLDTWGNESKQALMTLYKEVLASERYSIECCGVEFNGMKAYSDKQAQSSITSTLQLFSIGGIDSINFKFMDGWQVLTAEQFKLFAVTLSNHIQVCFNAEKVAIEKLNAMTLKELASFKENKFDGSRANKTESIVTLYKETLSALKAQLEANK